MPPDTLDTLHAMLAELQRRIAAVHNVGKKRWTRESDSYVWFSRECGEMYEKVQRMRKELR